MKMIKDSALKSVFNKSLKLKKSETCLIVTDTTLQDLAKPFFLFASQICKKASLEVIRPLGFDGNEPSKEVASLMKKFDVVLLITHNSISHTKARRDACASGSRIASMPGLTEAMANRCLDIDYNEISKFGEKLKNLIFKCEKIHITSKKGTDVILERGDQIPSNSSGLIFNKGNFSNLPDGEVDFSPENVQGKIVFDGSFPLFGLLKSPIILTVKDNRVINIEGKYTEELKEFLDDFGPNAYIIAELGIGTNPKAIVSGDVLEDEKALGTCHIALGNNMSYGRSNDVKMHMDGVIKSPTIRLDDKLIMEEGKVVF